MNKLNLIVSGLFMLVGMFALGYGLATTVKAKPMPAARTYNLFPSGPAGPHNTFRGQEIRSNGLCVEVWLNGRIDTIACGSGLVITEREETTGQPDQGVN